MDDIVAVEVRLASGPKRYFLTWGRIQDPVDAGLLEKLVLEQCSRFTLGGTPATARVCLSLQAAASEPYFYECFFSMCQKKIPFGTKYEQWKQEVSQAVQVGKDLYYLGNPETFRSL